MKRISAVLMTGFLLMAGCAGEDEGNFSGSLEDFYPVDEANLTVSFRLVNHGDEFARGECTIQAHDASRMVGWDIFGSKDEIAPGETVTLAGTIRIEDEGAYRVLNVRVKDCGSA